MDTSTFTETIEKVSADSNNYKIIKTISTKWNGTPSSIRYLLLGYTAVTITCYTVYNYNDGKRALLSYREYQKNTGNKLHDIPDEWTAIKTKIKHIDNFISALFFPWSVTEKIIPSIILYLNPKKD